MKKDWTYKKLGEVAEIIGGSTPSTSIPENWVGANQWVSPAELKGEKYFGQTIHTISDEAASKLKLLPVGTVLLSSRAPIGKLAITTQPMYCNQGFKNIVCGESLYNEYAYYCLKYYVPVLQKLGVGATFKEISKKMVEDFTIPIPPLCDQELIVRELDAIHGILEKKQEQLRELDHLAQAIFYEMFGDPITNPKQWEVKKLGEIFEISSGGTPSKTVKEYWDNGTIPWIGSNMCQNTVVYETDGKYITQKGLEKSSAKLLPIDSVLVALVGATIGKVALLKTESSTNQNIAFIKPHKDYNPIYVFYHLMNQYDLFMNIGNGDFKMATQGFIKGLSLMLAPLSLQQSFAAKIEAIEAQKTAIRQSIREVEALLAQRMDHYFN